MRVSIDAGVNELCLTELWGKRGEGKDAEGDI